MIYSSLYENRFRILRLNQILARYRVVLSCSEEETPNSHKQQWNNLSYLLVMREIYQSSNQEMFASSLSSCSRYNSNLNWTNQCPLFMTVRHIFEISEDDHTSLVTHARDNWSTLDFPNAFVSPGVNSRGELVPSHGASRRRLGDYGFVNMIMNFVLDCKMVCFV